MVTVTVRAPLLPASSRTRTVTSENPFVIRPVFQRTPAETVRVAADSMYPPPLARIAPRLAPPINAQPQPSAERVWIKYGKQGDTDKSKHRQAAANEDPVRHRYTTPDPSAARLLSPT